jgi:molybdopterin/thiamine biosynthesis adenylyltransferase
VKNLVLPGVGGFTMVDSNKVTTEDLGNNFFVTEESVGEVRAQSPTSPSAYVVLLLRLVLLLLRRSHARWLLWVAERLQ